MSEAQETWEANMEVQLDLREVYGKRKAYPVNTTAVLLSQIAGTKTLTTSTVRNAAKLGFHFVEVMSLSRKHLDLPPEIHTCSLGAQQLINLLGE